MTFITKIFWFCMLVVFPVNISLAQTTELGWEGNPIVAKSDFLTKSNWNSGAASGDQIQLSTDAESLNIHWKFGTGNRNKWVVCFMTLKSPISIGNSDIIGVDVKGSVCKDTRHFSIKFEDGSNQAVFYSHGLASVDRWVNRISILKKQFSGNPNWNNIKVIAFAISSDASASDTQADSGVVSIRNLQISNIESWQRATSIEELENTDLLDEVKNKTLEGILGRQVANGLLYTWKEDGSSWLYGHGLVLKALSLEGTWDNKTPVNDYAKAAEKLAIFLSTHQNVNGYWPRAWNTNTGTVKVNDEWLWMGDFPWMITGLVNYYAKSGDTRVLPAIIKASNFLYTLIEPSGKFYTINTITGAKSQVTSTEAYAAAIMSVFELGDTEKAMSMLNYISSATWDNTLLYWKEAIDSNRPVLFANTWMAMLNHYTNEPEKAINSLSFAGKVLNTRGPGNPEGFDGIGPIATWYEGTMTYICAGGPGSKVLFDSLITYRYADGTLPAYNENLGGKADIWAVKWSSLDATVWLYYAAAKKSPFKQYVTFSFPAGFENIDEQPGFTVYPVPAQDKLNLMVNNNYGRINEISIYDLTGKCLKTIPGSNLKNIDISLLSPGMFLCKVIFPDKTEFQKFEVMK